MSSEKFGQVKRYHCSNFVKKLPMHKPVMPHAPCRLPYFCELLRSTLGRNTTRGMYHWPTYHRFGESWSPEPRCPKDSVLTQLGSGCSGIWKKTYRRQESP